MRINQTHEPVLKRKSRSNGIYDLTVHCLNCNASHSARVSEKTVDEYWLLSCKACGSRGRDIEVSYLPAMPAA
ncbi:MAG: hypothetical protein PVG66_11010 [Chromatiales bacterium]|jgi:transcription elongation factor Elf1